MPIKMYYYYYYCIIIIIIIIVLFLCFCRRDGQGRKLKSFNGFEIGGVLALDQILIDTYSSGEKLNLKKSSQYKK